MSADELYNIINGDKSRFLSICTGLEHAIEILIGAYYTVNQEDYRDFANIIFHDENELTFSKKIKMIDRFLRRRVPDFLKDHPDFIMRLNRVRKIRNRFAHSINLTHHELEKFLEKNYFELGFIEEGIPKQEQITFKEILDRNKEAESLLNDIKKLYDKVVTEGFNRINTISESDQKN